MFIQWILHYLVWSVILISISRLRNRSGSGTLSTKYLFYIMFFSNMMYNLFIYIVYTVCIYVESNTFNIIRVERCMYGYFFNCCFHTVKLCNSVFLVYNNNFNFFSQIRYALHLPWYPLKDQKQANRYCSIYINNEYLPNVFSPTGVTLIFIDFIMKYGE